MRTENVIRVNIIGCTGSGKTTIRHIIEDALINYGIKCAVVPTLDEPVPQRGLLGFDDPKVQNIRKQRLVVIEECQVNRSSL